MDKIKKLSDGIRYGASLREQATCQLFKRSRINPDEYGSCALGAALEAALVSQGFEVDPANALCQFGRVSDIHDLLSRRYNVDLSRMMMCPGSYSLRCLSWIIVQLNDGFGWTRERIADWLESEGM